LCALLQLVAGHQSAGVVAKYQPAKLAALEGHYDGSKPADMYLFGYVDQKNQKTHGLAIPGGLSFLTKGDFKKPLTGLNNFKPDDRPKAVNFVFQTYHLMVAIGMFMIALTLYSCFLWWRGTLFNKKWLM
jgi:cytochrome d ubiquinol oxidase subunit I